MEFGILLRLVGQMILIYNYILSRPSYVQENTLCAFLEKCSVGLCSEIYRMISFRLSMMVKTELIVMPFTSLNDHDLHSRSLMY